MSRTIPFNATPAEPIVGCAGFSVPRAAWVHSGEDGSHLERTARLFNGVEVNSSFYRHHRLATYERWAASVPTNFRFAVKLFRGATHEKRLVATEPELDEFFAAAGGLGAKLGVVLVQTPPSLTFDPAVAASFFTAVRARYRGPLAVEPRHVTWGTEAADHVLKRFDAAGVAADPAPWAGAGEPRGASGLVYLRWHGSPKVYTSSYSRPALDELACQLKLWASRAKTWCIFDNTALGNATFNAHYVANGTRVDERGRSISRDPVQAPEQA